MTFRVTFSHQQFYYFTQENKQIAYPSPLNGRWKKERVQDHHASYVLVIPPTRARPAGAGEDTTSTSTTTIAVNRDNEPSGRSNIDEQPSPRKRPMLSEREDEVLGESAMSYWPDSSEARKLFRPRVTTRAAGADDDDPTTELSNETAHAALEQRIKLLQSAHENENG